MLKANSLFLYQVFPGNTSQWLKILHQAVNENKYSVTENLLSFFKEACPHLINSEEISSGCVALHLASQSGFFDTALLLLENGASVNKTDRNKHLPFYYALAGKHRDVSTAANLSPEKRAPD
ncbi:ankyrin-repeat domain containing transcription coregulator asaA-like [Rana temporaria]|uniref:ankyrin-repeat domain containing transcription coregulator asaA-like n=1 Tax=Rana temporaria TaxID=8407 RepID=UPI001AADF96E|nr:ankyrin-repeat domain containing transcription coregulator asaA-like [Rana temporaria]